MQLLNFKYNANYQDHSMKQNTRALRKTCKTPHPFPSHHPPTLLHPNKHSANVLKQTKLKEKPHTHKISLH